MGWLAVFSFVRVLRKLPPMGWGTGSLKKYPVWHCVMTGEFTKFIAVFGLQLTGYIMLKLLQQLLL